MTKILVTGANGMLGKAIQSYKNKYPDYQFFFTDKEELNICRKEVAASFVKFNQVEFIINCAAYTNVEKAEFKTKKANKLNHLAIKNLAEVAKENNIGVIHISTDYVFDGESEIPYVESDETNPQNVYGISKLKGENVLREVNPKNSAIIRTSWLYGEDGNNFVKTILDLAEEKESLSIVNDQIGAPTYAKDLAKAILEIIPKLKNEDVAVYHYANTGNCSWFEFAQEIVKIAGLTCELKGVSSDEYPTDAKRPNFSLLNTEKIEQAFGVAIPNWKDSLKICIEELVRSDA